MSDIEQVLKSELDGIFLDKGYSVDDFCYFLNKENSLTYCVSFDFEGGSYRVFVGVARRTVDEDLDKAPEGAYLHRFFTGGSLSTSPKDFSFKSEKDLRSHLIRLKNNLQNLIFPFLESVTDLEEYADSLSEADCLVSYEIYQELGLKDKAAQKGQVVLDHYKNMRDIEKIDMKLGEIEDFLVAEDKTLNKSL